MKFLLVPILAIFIDIIYLQVSVINRVSNILNTKLTLSSRGNSINNKTIDTGFSAGDYLLVRRHNTSKGIKDIAEEVSLIF
jgi:predicted aspartyl protease